MAVKKLILVRYIPLTEVIYNKFYLPEVCASGIAVEYWDITRLFFKDTGNQEDSSDLCTTYKINSYRELAEKINAEDRSSTLFFPIMTLEGGLRKLYRIFTRYDCRLIIFGRNIFPAPPHNSSDTLLKRILRITPRKALNKINGKRLYREFKNGKIKRFETVFLGGRFGYQGIGLYPPETLALSRIVQVNSDDYDTALHIYDENPQPIVDGKYILFLDEYLPLHPDIAMLGLQKIAPEAYYPQLNRFFDKVEARFGMPVVIAAHPKALRYKERDYFEGRKLFFGKSAVLSKDAQLVIAHDSTSINYPVAFGKPLLLVTSKNIEAGMSFIHADVLHFAEYLGCDWRYFDDLQGDIAVPEVNEQRYRAYKYDFQTSPETENKSSSEIFTSFLKNAD